MEATQVDFFPTRLSMDSLCRLVILDSNIVVGKCSRLTVWLNEYINAECERRDSDGRFEPGCPMIDLHSWTDSDIASGLQCLLDLRQSSIETADLNSFVRSLLTVFVEAATA